MKKIFLKRSVSFAVVIALVVWAFLVASPLSVKPKRAVFAARDITAQATSDNGTEYHTLEYGEYPQTYVGDELNEKLENAYQDEDESLTRDKKSYTTNSTRASNGSGYVGGYTPTLNYEFEYEGQKYVRLINRVDPQSTNGGSTASSAKTYYYSENVEVPANDTPVWFLVQPITWVILNWDNLPKDINHENESQSSDEKYELLSLNSLISGIPFNSSTTESMWANSTLRTYLNGVFISEAFVQNGCDADKQIADTTISNCNINGSNKNTEGQAGSDYDTNDKVYLLSWYDVIGADPLPPSGQTHSNPTIPLLKDLSINAVPTTDYSISTDGQCFYAGENNNRYTNVYLRSAGNSNSTASGLAVIADSNPIETQSASSQVNNLQRGLRPAMSLNIYRITASSDENGTINPSVDEFLNYGDSSSTYIFTPNPGYKVDSIKIDGEPLTDEEFDAAVLNGYTFQDVADNHTIEVAFTEAEYKITFDSDNINVQVNGTEISPEYKAEYGDLVTYNKIVELKDWENIEWSTTGLSENGEVDGSGDISILYKITYNSYTITFKNYDGTELYSADFEYETTPTYGGENPTKQATDMYEFTFKGWNTTDTGDDGDVLDGLHSVTGPATYYAIFSSNLRSYSITFIVSDDNSQNNTVSFDFGTIPSYGDVNPTKQATDMYEFTFKGWNTTDTGDDGEIITDELPSVTGPATYYAIFSSETRKYTIKFIDYNGTILSFETYEYNAEVVVPETDELIKSADNYNTYEFDGWDPEFESTVTKDATYTAQYKATPIMYIITFYASDGETVISTKSYGYGEEISPTPPVAPEGYVFDGWYTDDDELWDTSLNTVTGSMTLTARFKPADDSTPPAVTPSTFPKWLPYAIGGGALALCLLILIIIIASKHKNKNKKIK